MKKTCFPALVILSFFIFTQCSGPLLDRVTVVYGTITNEQNQPLDSVEIVLSGRVFLKTHHMVTTFSDKDGKYEILIDPPLKFNSFDIRLEWDQYHDRDTNPIIHIGHLSWGSQTTTVTFNQEKKYGTISSFKQNRSWKISLKVHW